MPGSFQTVELASVSFHWDDTACHCFTRWPDGVVCPASPEATDAYAAEAERRGCSSIWHCCRQHEWTHSVAMVFLGYPCSPTLRWWAATNGRQRWGRADAEEKLVFDLQRLANGVTDRMPHGDHGLSLRGPLSPGEWERVGAMARLG